MRERERDSIKAYDSANVFEIQYHFLEWLLTLKNTSEDADISFERNCSLQSLKMDLISVTYIDRNTTTFVSLTQLSSLTFLYYDMTFVLTMCELEILNVSSRWGC